MKKIIPIIFTFALLLTYFHTPTNVDAKTLGDLKKELEIKLKKAEQTEQDLNNVKNQVNNTTTQVAEKRSAIAKIQSNISSITQRLVSIQNKIDVQNEQINKYNDEISTINEDIKDVMVFYQSTNSKMGYFEFIFGAKSLTDFVRRISTVTTISEYNNELMEEMKALLKQVKAEKAKLVDLEASMKSDQAELGTQMANLKIIMAGLKDELSGLNSDLNELSDQFESELVSIKQQQATIKSYEQLGCRLDEQLDSCMDRIDQDVAFVRPMVKGYITSEYGYRVHPIFGTVKFHSGIDIAGVPAYTPVYSAAAGFVAYVNYDTSSAGGKYVIIHHVINGKKYSTYYAHFNDIKVHAGQKVTKDTVIGLMGSTGNSTGAHLHFTVMNGHFLKDYGWSSFNQMTTNPRNVVTFPRTLRTYFYDRYTKY